MTATRLSVCIADPPYIGQGRHYDGQEVNYPLLVRRLVKEFDAWALCLSSPTLREVLAMCPNDVRVGAWVKPFAVFKPNVNPGFCWEPVIFWGGRKLGRDVDTVRDWVDANITMETGVVGAKPERFCFWLFQMLGMEPQDTLHDLYPGSGAIGRAWETWKSQERFLSGATALQESL